MKTKLTAAYVLVCALLMAGLLLGQPFALAANVAAVVSAIWTTYYGMSHGRDVMQKWGDEAQQAAADIKARAKDAA